MDELVIYLLFSPTATPQKRQHSAMSSPGGSPIQNNPPSYKRIRLMSDSSTDGESSSQGQTTSTKVADELPFVDKVNYLHSNFPTYTKEVSLSNNFISLRLSNPKYPFQYFSQNHCANAETDTNTFVSLVIWYFLKYFYVIRF